MTDKMEVVRYEVSASFLFSTSVSDPSSCCELFAHRLSSSQVEGYAKLLRATMLDQGIKEVGDGWMSEGIDR